MTSVTMYSKPGCPYCVRAKRLLLEKGVDVKDIAAAFDPDLKAEMLQRSNGARTYPQIFIGERHVGGCDDLMALDREGKLDQMLAA